MDQHPRVVQTPGDQQAALLGAEAAVAARDARIRAEAERARVRQVTKRGDQATPVCRDSLRAALLGDLAPGELVRVAQDLAAAEQAAGRGWDVLPPRLPGGARDPWHHAVSQVRAAARVGDVPRIQAAIVTAGGWADRDAGALAGPQTGGAVTVSGAR